MINHWITQLSWGASAWIGTALGLAVLEVLLGSNFFLLSLGIVCLGVGCLVYLMPVMSAEIQFVIFGVGSLVSVGIWSYYLRVRPRHSPSRLNRRAEQYIGRTFTLSEAIVNGRGKIRVEDSTWSVEGPELPVGTVVEIVGVDGVILTVKPRSSAIVN